MATPLIDPEDLALFWRPLTVAETTVAETLIGVASGMIRRRIPDVDAQITAGTLDLDLVGYVISEMVKAAVDSTGRPVDAKSTSDTVGPYSHAVTYGAASRLAFTDDLFGMLGGAVASGLGSARLGLPNIHHHHGDYGHRENWSHWR
jgi:hypothetical protein